MRKHPGLHTLVIHNQYGRNEGVWLVFSPWPQDKTIDALCEWFHVTFQKGCCAERQIKAGASQWLVGCQWVLPLSVHQRLGIYWLLYKKWLKTKIQLHYHNNCWDRSGTKHLVVTNMILCGEVCCVYVCVWASWFHVFGICKVLVLPLVAYRGQCYIWFGNTSPPPPLLTTSIFGLKLSVWNDK